MFKWILLGGWVFLIVGAFAIVVFPNAEWNHSASWIVWILSIVLTLLTLGICLIFAIRLLAKLIKLPAASPIGEVPQLTTHQQNSWRRRLRLGLVCVVVIAVFAASLLAFIEYEVKLSPVYKASVARANASTSVIDILGQPIQAGWFTSGELTQSSNGGGHARLTISVSGPKGKGRLEIEALRVAGIWEFLTLQFIPSTNASTVNLLAGQRWD